MPGSYVVVLGGSAGAIEALLQIVASLPANFPAALFVAVHHSGTVPSSLPHILRRAGPLPAFHAGNAERVVPGRIYVAPPGYHLTFSDSETRIIEGPRENGHRPSIDVLFRSAAQVYDSAVIGVLVSGTLDDGTAGMAAIKSQGGTTIAQDPEEALFPDMPQSAIANIGMDYVLRATDIAALLQRLVSEPVTRHESSQPMLDQTGTGADDFPRSGPSTFVCPQCGGTLFDVADEHAPHYRCRVGHAYSPQVLLSSQNEALEAALWTALRSMEEQMELGERLVLRSRGLNLKLAADRIEARMAKIRRCADIIRTALDEPPWTDDAHLGNGFDVETGAV